MQGLLRRDFGLLTMFWLLLQEALPGREKTTIDGFIRRNTNQQYHFEQFLPGYTGPTFAWPTPAHPKSEPLKPSSRQMQIKKGSSARPRFDLAGIMPLKLQHPSRTWAREEHSKLVEGLRKFCRDVARLQVSSLAIEMPMTHHKPIMRSRFQYQLQIASSAGPFSQVKMHSYGSMTQQILLISKSPTSLSAQEDEAWVHHTAAACGTKPGHHCRWRCPMSLCISAYSCLGILCRGATTLEAPPKAALLSFQ